MATTVKDREAYLRLNYLYQAAHCVLSENPENVELARFYCSTQKTIARRLVLRQDPSIKRTLCKKCCSLLIPGITATVRQRRKNRKTRFTVVRCVTCGQSKALLNNPEHRLWADRAEALLEQQKQPDPGPSVKKQPKNKKPGGPKSSKLTAAQSTAAQSTAAASTAAQSTDAQSTDAQSTDAQSTDAQSTDAQSTAAQSTAAQSTAAQSTDAQSTAAQSTDAQSTDAQSTDAQSTDAQSTDAQSTAST